MKLLLWAALVLLVIWVLRKKKNTAAADMPPARRPPMLNEGEAMLVCAHCGVHFPASEAVHGSGDTVFCSDQHRSRHAVH
jgi:uncharacterized protein